MVEKYQHQILGILSIVEVVDFSCKGNDVEKQVELEENNACAGSGWI